VKEIDALFDGYIRRDERIEDLFILYCGLPAMRGPLKNPPSYRKLTAHRRNRNDPAGEIDEATQNKWREILKGGIHV